MVLRYEGFDPDFRTTREALCTLGNGYFATRGAAPEATADGSTIRAPLWPACLTGASPGSHERTVENESIVNLPNWLPLTFRIDDGPGSDSATSRFSTSGRS